MAEAVVGDEQKREDPTVTALEERVAELLGQDEAVYLPTATMGNQIALRLLSEPGDELIGTHDSHIFLHELGGPAVHSGLVMKPLPSVAGRFDARSSPRRDQPARRPARGADARAHAREHAQRRRRAGVGARATTAPSSPRPASTGSRCTSTARGC